MDSTRDMVALPGQDGPVNKKAAKKELISPVILDKPKPNNYYIDAPYTVEGIDTKTSKWKIFLLYGADTRFRAQVNLEQSEMQKLLDAFKAASEKGSKIAPNLHVSAEIGPKGVKSAIVVGVGKPRAASVAIAQAFEKEKSHTKI